MAKPFAKRHRMRSEKNAARNEKKRTEQQLKAFILQNRPAKHTETNNAKSSEKKKVERCIHKIYKRNKGRPFNKIKYTNDWIWKMESCTICGCFVRWLWMLSIE